MSFTCTICHLLVAIVVGTSAAPSTPLNQPRDQHIDTRTTDPFTLPAALQPELNSAHWLEQGAEFVQRQRAKPMNLRRAKNVILFLGDGMSVATLTATRAYLGGEHLQLPFERFPTVGMSRTYCVDYQVPDSACTATAYLTGVKGNYGTIGLTAAVPRGNCEDGVLAEHHTSSIAAWAQRSGVATGVVTTTRVTHASPAGVYAHIADRDWENNKQVKDGPCKQKYVDDIAKQLVHGEVGGALRVVLGGGRREFLDKSLLDEEGGKGKRTDGRNLIEEWLAEKRSETDEKRYVWNKAGLFDVNVTDTDYLLGLFETSHCRFNLDIRAEDIADREPTLSEMVDRALDVLTKHPDDGFFLFVEGGRIDHAHHQTRAQYALEETAEFGRAVDLAHGRLGAAGDTLIVVTADHAHTMTYAGYGDRGANVLGTAELSNVDGLAYMTLGYANGPGYVENVNQTTFGRIDPASLDTHRLAYTWPTMLPLDKETHGGEDVTVYATGPWSHLFGGGLEQNSLPHMMAYASCWGDGRTMCDDGAGGGE